MLLMQWMLRFGISNFKTNKRSKKARLPLAFAITTRNQNVGVAFCLQAYYPILNVRL